MGLLNVPGREGYKGLRQDIDYPELPKQYCHELENINVDDPVGSQTIRGGSSKYHANAAAFTNLLSSYEYRFNKGGSTRSIVNDADIAGDGTLKVSSDSGNSWANLTLPAGATLESSFQNQYFGWQDHVLITAGSGSTNYMLWYGYTERLTSENDGLFGDALNDAGTYRLLKAQLISEGTFSRLASAVEISDRYYLSFRDTHFIEVRNSEYQLIERKPIPLYGVGGSTYDPVDNSYTRLATDGTYLYAVVDNGVQELWKINPVDWSYNFKNISAGTGRAIDVAVNSTHVFVLKTDRIEKLLISDLSDVANTSTLTNGTCIEADDTAIYVGDFNGSGNPIVTRRLVGTIGTVASTSPEFTTVTGSVDMVFDLYIDETNGHVYVTVTDNETTDPIDDFQDTVWRLTIASFSGAATAYTNINHASVFFPSGSDVPYCISYPYGTLQTIATKSIAAPINASLFIRDTASTGSLDAGTYFYKMSIVDIDGIEYVLGDPVVYHADGTNDSIAIYLTVPESQLAQMYRVKSFNIYRAYNSDGEDELSPETEYKFLKEVGINERSVEAAWTHDATNELYYVVYYDEVSEAEISSVTYFESSGIGENVKPRYVNGKYLTWQDDQLYVGGYHHDGDDFPYGFVRSPINQPNNITVYDPFGYEAGGGDPIVDITNSYGRVVVFKSRTFAVYFDGTKEREYDYGIVSSFAFTKVNEDIYFVSPEKKIYVFNGTDVFNIGDAVKTYIDEISFTKAAVHFIEKEDKLLFSIRDDRVFCYNVKHKVWNGKYTSNFAFWGFFKNYANEYIAWGQTALYKIFDGSTKDKEDAGGGNGTAIACIYESPLLRFSRNEGELVTLIGMRHRYERNSGDVCNCKIYEYDTTKALKETIALGVGLVARDFISSLLGENYVFRLEITTPADTDNSAKFEHHGSSIEYQAGGYEI